MSKKYSISYPQLITWRTDLKPIQSVDSLFSKSTLKKIRSTCQRLMHLGYEFTIEDLTFDILNWFEIKHSDHISKKNNPHVMGIKNKVIDDLNKNKIVKTILLRYGGFFDGALFFTVNKNNISVSYKYFPLKTKDKLPISLTYIAEYMLFEYAIVNKFDHIKHGKDDNVFGVFSDIGLSRFKLQLGLKPRISSDPDNSILDEFEWDEKRDVLIFEYSLNSIEITAATLFLHDKSEENMKKYESIINNPLLSVTVITL